MVGRARHALNAFAAPDARDGEELKRPTSRPDAGAAGQAGDGSAVLRGRPGRSPHRGQRPQSRVPHLAARAAALAGAGKAEGEPLDEEAKARWRKQALDWLKADLARRVAQVRAESPDGTRVGQRLQHWKAEPDLAGVRDPDALATLPEPEREGWRALWDEVDRLLEEAGKTP